MKKKLSILAMSLMLASSGWATLTDDGTYFLYNVGAQKWLNFGSTNGQTATFYKHGTPLTITKTEGGYTLQAPFYDAKNYLTAAGAMGDVTQLVITEVGEGLYTIGNGSTLMGWDGTTDLNTPPYSTKTLKTDLTDAGSANAQWQILSKQEMLAALSEASESAKDATFMIQSPNFHRHDAGCYNTAPNGKLVWTGLESGNHGYAAGYEADYCGFVFNTGSVNIHQDITGLPAGIYEVSVQGFSRYGSNTDATGTYASNTPQATLFAGEESTPLMKLTDDLATESSFYSNAKKYGSGYVPYFNNDGGKTTSNSNVEACKAFDYGMYGKNSVRVTVGGDGTLRIGINVPADARTNSWTAFDNFELKYYGPLSSISEEMQAELLASVPAGKMNAKVEEALNQAVEAFKANVNVDTYNALGAAIQDAKASVEAYKAIKEALDKATATELQEQVAEHLNTALNDIMTGYENGTIEGDGSKEVEAIAEALKAAIIENNADNVDKTALIVNPKFDDGKNGWSGNFGTGAVKATSTNPLITAYGGTFNVYQDVEGLANGTYKLQVQAFTRPMDHNDMKTALNEGKTLNNETYMYANESEKLVKLIIEDYGTTSAWGTEFATGKYVPNSSGDAAQAFNAGLYENEMLFVVTDNKARIGIRQDATDGTPYVGYDNFRLTFVSADTKLPEEEKPALTSAEVMALLENANKVAKQAEDHSSFDTAYETEKANLAAADLTSEQLEGIKENIMKALAVQLKASKPANGQYNLTALIANATFDKNLDGWNTAKPFAWNSIGVAQVSNAQKGGQLTQVLSHMPAGKYTLKVQGFYRQSGWKEGLYEYEHGNREDQLQLVLNEVSKPIKSLFDDGRSSLASANISRTEDVGSTIDGRGFPHLLSKVQDSFTPGHYWNYLEVEVKEDGDITFGANLGATELSDNWVILDNFRLYYGELSDFVLTKTTKIKEDTPANVRIVKSFTADELTPFAAPCDIPGSLFKAVYEIGKLDYSTRTMTLYPVENVRAGVPCCVVTSTDIDTLNVGHTLLIGAEADTRELIWDGGLIQPYYSSLNWRNTDSKGTQHAATAFNKVEIQDLQHMYFNVNLENYQVRRFLATKYAQTTASVIGSYNQPSPARRDIAHSVGIPVPASKAGSAVVKYCLNEDMSDAKSINVVNGNTVCYIPNLIPNEMYYFEVAQGGETAVKGKFTTEGPLRQLYAPSIYNIRDFGGWVTQDGSTTRYGLIYRGGEVNGFHAPYQKDVETLKSLGIGAEIDLRYNDSYDQDRETGKSGFGFTKGDTYYFAGANDYTAANLSEAGTQARLKEEFRFLLGHIREGRGVYFHCVFGADRTGFFAVLLEGLLGMNLNDLYHDYEFTSFAAPAGNRNKDAIQERIAVIQKRTGKTLRDKFEDYWLNAVGITADEVAEFRSLMLYNPTPVGIQDIMTEEDADQVQTVKAIYNVNGTKVSESVLGNQAGIYVIQYNNGKTMKVVKK